MTYKVIDLFAGIGGFHLAFHQLGAECVFSSEWDESARKTYEHNFKSISPELFKSGNFAGDITKIDKSEIPDFDILCGGFPCQPFSIAGVSKKKSLGSICYFHSYIYFYIVMLKLY
jgi:DNA (cytosine-5)-methyltransferase 1